MRPPMRLRLQADGRESGADQLAHREHSGGAGTDHDDIGTKRQPTCTMSIRLLRLIHKNRLPTSDHKNQTQTSRTTLPYARGARQVSLGMRVPTSVTCPARQGTSSLRARAVEFFADNSGFALDRLNAARYYYLL
jgi:hypothetical protein